MRRGSEGKREKVSGDNGWREPPVPIPNTEVKPPHADGTELGTAWESRTLPGSRKWSGGNGSFSRSCPMRGKRKGSGSEGARTAKAGSAGQREKERKGRRSKRRRPGEEKKQAGKQKRMILSSSMAEHSAVNRRVVSSSLT